MNAKPDTVTRFWSRVDKSGDCWTWTEDQGRYARFYANKRQHFAHRYAYELVHGPVPTGLVIDHLCRNRRCVRPSHLEAVPQRVNVLRGIGLPALNAKKTHCKRGHLLAGDNIYVNPRDGIRNCRPCKAFRQRQARRAA